MSIYHYATITGGDTSELNRLLTRGWTPVREFSSGPAAVTVLLQKDGEVRPFPDEEVANGISVASLSDVPVLTGLSEPEIRQLLTVCETRIFAEGDVIFQPGDTDPALYIILSGDVELALPPLPGEEAVIMRIGARDMFGESSFWSAQPHAVTARAVSEVTLLKLPRDRFDELLQSGHGAAQTLLMNSASILAARLHNTDDWLHQLLEQEQNARIAASWRRFREHLGSASWHAHGLFHT